MKVIVEMVEREPSVSPVSMEVGVTFGQWFLESGFVREANIAFRAAVEAADVFDRWNTWAKGSTGLITTSLLLGDFTPIHQLVDPRIALFRLGPAVEVKKTDLDEVLGVLLGATVVNVILGACTGESPYRMHMDLVIKFMCPSSTNTWTNEMGSKPSLRKVSPDAFTDPKKRRASEKEVGAKGEFGARISGLDGKNSEGAESKFTTQVRTESTFLCCLRRII
ncbi:hypothetical protein BC829DRAFT_123042 [Chytridium lagenaria]|nr:hypothetical protein BC829DRAFT_123042 [Chytridium lagenaria]